MSHPSIIRVSLANFIFAPKAWPFADNIVSKSRPILLHAVKYPQLMEWTGALGS